MIHKIRMSSQYGLPTTNCGLLCKSIGSQDAKPGQNSRKYNRCMIQRMTRDEKSINVPCARRIEAGLLSKPYLLSYKPF